MAANQSSSPLSILHLEDDASFARKVNQKLIEDGFNISIELVRTYKDFLEQINQRSYQFIFLDDRVSDGTGLQALEVIAQQQLPVSVVMFSEFLDEVAIVEYMKHGATDYVLKSNLKRLPEVMRNIIDENQKKNNTIDFPKFFETSTDLLCSCDKQGRLIELNNAWANILGYEIDELKNKALLELIYPDDRQTVLSQYQAMFDTSKSQNEFTACFVARNGDMRWLQWHATRQNGDVLYVIARDITELKQNEIKLNRENESLNRQIEQYKVEVTQKSIVADQIHDSVITTDLKGIITSWNHGSERVFGYSAGQAVGQHIALVYPEKDYKLIQEQAANILLEQGTQDFEIQMRRESGEVFDARLSLGVTRDHSGEVNGMVGYAVDMGPVNVPEPNIIPGNQHLESVIETSPVVTYACDWQGTYRLHHVSPNIEVLYGYSLENCVENENFLLEHCHPDDREQLHKALDNLAETETYSHAYRVEKANGEYCWVHNELKLLKNDASEPEEIVGLLIDVDQLHYGQQQAPDHRELLQEKEQQLGEVNQQVQQLEQKLLNAEQQLNQIHQGQQDKQDQQQSLQKLEQQLSEVQQQAQRWEQQFMELQQQAQHQEQQWGNQLRERQQKAEHLEQKLLDAEQRLQQAQQGEHQQQDYQQLLNDKDRQLDEAQEKARQWEVQLRESQQQAQQREQHQEQQLQNAEQQLNQMKTELQTAMQSLEQFRNQEPPGADTSADTERHTTVESVEKNAQMRSEFLSGISHELRVTLNAILGFAQIMALDEALTDNNRQYLGEINDAGTRLLDIVNRVLDVVNLENATICLTQESVSVQQLMEECLENLSSLVNRQGVQIVMSHENIAPDYEIHGDKQRLMQVITYVLASAVKNAAADSKVAINLKRQGGDLRITVKNESTPGNSEVPTALPSSDNSPHGEKRSVNNARLDLLITQALLELMGGTLRYEFNPDKVIAITLPESNSASIEEQHSTASEEAEENAGRKEEVILYVEDDAASIRLVETLLKQRPECKVIATRGSAQCTELMERYHPCMVLLNINLSDTDAYRLLEQWQRHSVLQDIPVTVVTTDMLPAEVAKLRDSGVLEVLPKPIEINRLLQVVDTVIAEPPVQALKQIQSN